MATIMTKDSPTQMATVRPGVFKVPPPDPDRAGEVLNLPVELSDADVGLEAVPVESFATKVSIRDAEIIVAGGHGFRSRADFDTYLAPLATGLGRLLGASTKVAASRMAVEDGFTTHDYQVGQTGQTVQPRLYVAIGISGAVQHITGMQGSRDRRRHQQGSEGADLQLRGLRRRRRHRDGRPRADPRDGGCRVNAPIDVLIVGAGPAGLAAAIRLKQQLAAASSDASVVVIDKSPRPGYHCLSGAAFEPEVLDQLVEGWRDDRRFMEHVVPVERDDMYFLLGKRAIRVPPLAVPKGMDHHGDVTISLSRLVGFLADKAEKAGVELYNGYSARTLLVEDDRVVGVALGEVGARRPRRRQAEPPAGRGDPGPGDDPGRRHAGRPLDAAPRALRRGPEPAGLLARDQGGRRRSRTRTRSGTTAFSTPSVRRTRPASSAAGSCTRWARRRSRSA